MITRERKTYKASHPYPAGGVTVSDLAAWCEERGINPSEAHCSGGHVIYLYTETADEAALRIEREEASEARSKEWVRKRYHELFPDGE